VVGDRSFHQEPDRRRTTRPGDSRVVLVLHVRSLAAAMFAARYFQKVV
jgi:hypothetical protein